MTDHKPGPEFDRTIATEVMGLLIKEMGVADEFGGVHWNHYVIPKISTEPGADNTMYGVKNYSGSISAAFEVVNHLIDTRQFRFGIHKGNVKNWTASFRRHFRSPSKHMKTVRTADTAPMAICLAALKAVK